MDSQAIVYGSLKDIANRSGKGLAHTFLTVDALILVDTSSSMDDTDCAGGCRRYDLATEQLVGLQREIPGKVGVISWNNNATFCPGGIPTSPSGGTDMANALRFAQRADGTGIRLILISDGEPDSEEKTLDVAKTFTSKIDTIFVGPEDSPGRDFLRRLAEATGGKPITQSVNEIAQLSQTVKGLLAA